MEAEGFIINTSMRSNVQDLVNVVEKGVSCQLGARGPQCSELCWKSVLTEVLSGFCPSFHASYASPADT